MQAVIMAGGQGVRLFPYTSVIPKPLLPLDDTPIIEIIIKQLVNHGFPRISIATGYLGNLLQAYLGDGSKYGVSLDYSFEKKPMGTIAPLKLIKNPASTILAMNADLLTDLNFRELVEYHRDHDAIVTIGMYPKKIKSEYGVIETNGGNELKAIKEKPEISMNVNMGIYAFSSRIIDYIPEDEPVDLPDLINRLVAEGEKVVGYPFDGYWLDIGQHVDYDRALHEFTQKRGELHID